MSLQEVFDEKQNFLSPAAVLKEIGVKSGDIVVDYGSGAGHWSVPAAKVVAPKGIVYAIDDNIDILKLLKSRAEIQRISNIEIEELNLEKEDSNFDVQADYIIVANVLHWMKNKDRFVKRLEKLLKDNGKVLVINWSKGRTLFGPQEKDRISEEDAITLFENNSYHLVCSVNAGYHHYGLIFDKKRR